MISFETLRKSKKAQAVLVSAASTLLVAGCSRQPEIHSGKIINKQDIPAHTEERYVTEYVYDCSFKMDMKGKMRYFCGYGNEQVLRPFPVPEEFVITIQNCDVKDGDGVCATRSVDVGSYDYSRLEMGEPYQVPGEQSS